MLSTVQFAFLCLAALSGVLGAAWIVAQAIQKTAANPVYDEKFKRLDSDMKEIRDLFRDLAKQVSEVRHAVNNHRLVMEGIPNILMQKLMELGLVHTTRTGA